MKTRPNILFMVQLPPPVHGAGLRNKSLMESSLVNENFNILPLPIFFADEVKDIGKFSIKKIWLTISYCSRLIWMLIRHRIDLAYFTLSPFGFAFYRDVIIVTILKIFSVKRLYHLRIRGLQQTAGSALGRRLVRYCFDHARVVCLSKKHEEDLQGIHPLKIFVVPNGIKIEEVPRDVAAPDPLIPRLLFISNLARNKGVFDLLQALSVLNREQLPFSAALVGAEHDIPSEELDQFLEANQLQAKVSLPGPKYGADKFRMLAACDVFVFPTRFELFPGVVLEAMQFGKPIVTTFEGAIPEMIDNGVNGLLVPKEDVSSLASAIRLLLKDEHLRQSLGSAAKAKFFAEFTMARFEANMKDVFTEACSGK